MSMWISAGKRPGRHHRQNGIPCQDAFAVHSDPERGRAAAAVGDGLGSKPLSHFGSQAACDAAVASLQAEAAWDRDALVRAFQAAHDAVAAAAAQRGLEPHELATTLQVALLDGSHALAGMVGDGAVVAAGPDVGPDAGVVRVAATDGTLANAAGGASAATTTAAAASNPTLLVAPATSGYANEVAPLTSSTWQESLQVAERDGVDSVLLFTDGLTRLLLGRSKAGWAPFAPFFDAFLPRLGGSTADPNLAERFLAGDDVDRSWDDDKCLVVLHGAKAQTRGLPP